MIALERHCAAHGVADIIPNGFICTCGERVYVRTGRLVWQERDAHIAESWREARTIRTADELDALPVNSIVRDATGFIGITGDNIHGEDIRDGWAESPVTVLWTPEGGAL